MASAGNEDSDVDEFMIVCPNCGSTGSAVCVEPDRPSQLGQAPAVIRLSREFYRRVGLNNALEMVCDACQIVVEFHGTATWLRRARPADHPGRSPAATRPLR